METGKCEFAFASFHSLRLFASVYEFMSDCHFETREVAGAVDQIGRAVLVEPNFVGMAIGEVGLIDPSPAVREAGEIEGVEKADSRVVAPTGSFAGPRRVAVAGQVGPNSAVWVVVARIGSGVVAETEWADSRVVVVFAEQVDSTAAVTGSSCFVAGKAIVLIGQILKRGTRELCGRCGYVARCKGQAGQRGQRG